MVTNSELDRAWNIYELFGREGRLLFACRLFAFIVILVKSLMSQGNAKLA